MSTRFRTTLQCMAIAMLLSLSASAQAASIPISDPGFDFYQAGTTTLIGDKQGTLGLLTVSPAGGGGPQTSVVLGDSNTSAPTGNLGDIPAGWTATGSPAAPTFNLTGRFRSDGEFISPTGSVAQIFSGNFAPATFYQALPSTSVLPNSVYNLKFDVLDRNPAPYDPNHMDISGLGAIITGSLLAGGPGGTDLGGSVSFVAPGSGGTSVYSLMVTTGAVVPAGNLTIVLGAMGNSLTPGSTITLTCFDNVSLTATAIPEPCTFVLLSLGAVVITCVRRRINA